MDRTLEEIFEANNGYLETKVLQKRSSFYYLRQSIEKGEVIAIKRGLYRLASLDGDNELAEVCRIISSGVICLFSAWHYYELTTFIPSIHYVAIPSKMKRTLPAYPPIQLNYWKEIQYQLGKKVVDHNGETIRIYDMEKSVCDAMKFRNKVGEEQTIEVLKNYTNRSDRNLDKLLNYAHQLKVENVLQQHLKLLL
jgi:predicted transcriptional regulator of viral defense system